MKKYILLFILLIIPFSVNAETCDVNKIKIESISVIEQSDNVNFKEDPTINGKEINLNLNFLEVGDRIKYKLVVKNESAEEFNLDSSNVSTDYVDYTINSYDGNVLKANTSKILFLTINYKKEVPSDKLVNGFFNDSKK